MTDVSAANMKVTALEEPTEGRGALLASALKSFAEHGLNGVSLRTITAQAGQLNQSAIRYHFGDKEGLVAAVLADVMAILARYQSQSLEELQARSSNQPWTMRELVQVMFHPFLMVYAAEPLGLQRIRFLSRLTWQEGGKGQAMLVAAVQPYFLQFSDVLQALSPHKTQAALALHLYLAVNTLIHGLADASLLQAHPVFGLDTLHQTQPDVLLNYFYDYLAGGLASA